MKYNWHTLISTYLSVHLDTLWHTCSGNHHTIKIMNVSITLESFLLFIISHTFRLIHKLIDLLSNTIHYFAFPRILCKRIYTMCPSFCLPTFSQCNYFVIHMLLYISTARSFSLLSSILLYGYTTLCLCIHLLKNI